MTKLNIDTSRPVLVTGATGYVAGQLIKTLLSEGLTVHAAVRDPGNKEKVKYLKNLDESNENNLKFFKADLLIDGSYADSMKDCQVVFHTASPFFLNFKDAQKELIDPALKGTRNVLEEAKKHNSVKRVVLTSSVAAMYGDNIDLKNTERNIFDEHSWNSSSSVGHQPYSYSKLLAEKEAWKISKEQDKWDLVVINPSFVIGPGINPYGTSESFNILKQFGDGTMKTGVPHFEIGAVDVRDIAQAHFRAAFNPNANGRYVASGHNTSFFEMAQSLSEKFGNEFPLPKKVLPKWLIWFVGPILNKGMTRKMVSLNMGLPFRADNSKIRKDLGIDFRPLNTTMNEFFSQLVEADYFKRN